MSLFLKLVLAHLIGDFPLQTNKIFLIKIRYKWGTLLHSSIIGAVTLLMAYTYLGNPEVIGVIVILWIFHAMQDRAKIGYNTDIARDNVWTFLFDQAVHIAAIGLMCYIVRNARPTFPLAKPDWFATIYNRDSLITAGIWLVVVSYGGVIFLAYIMKSLKGEKGHSIKLPDPKIKYLTMFERTAIALLIFSGGWPLALVPLALAPSSVLCWKGGLSPAGLAAGWAYAAAVGALMRLTV